MRNLQSSFEIQALPGTYILVLRSRKTDTIDIGKLGSMDLLHGHYLYVGSAFGPGGLKARVTRHIKTEKPLKWHIDYLRNHCSLEHSYISYDTTKQESIWVEKFLENPLYKIALQGFGASDSRYPSHLFYSAVLPTDTQITQTLATEGLIKLTKES